MFSKFDVANAAAARILAKIQTMTPVIARNFFFNSQQFRGFVLFTVLLLLTGTLPLLAQKPAEKETPSVVIPDTLLFKIENAQAVITQINAANKKGYGSADIRRELGVAKTNVAQIQEAVKVEKTAPDSKSLANYRLMLTDIQQKTSAWRKQLSRYNAELQSMSSSVIEFGRDSLLTIDNGDSTQKKLYKGQIGELRRKLQEAGETTTANLDTVSNLLADVSEVYFAANDLSGTINDYIKESGKNLLGQESSYIWKARQKDSSDNMNRLIKVSYAGQNKVLRYFLQSTWDNRVFLLLLCIGFFAWIYINFNFAKSARLSKDVGPLDFKFIGHKPFLATLILLFNITPLFEPRSPSIYIELNQFLLVITLTFFFLKMLPREQLAWWFSVIVLYLLTVGANVVVDGSFLLRFAFLGLSAASIAFGWWFFKIVRKANLGERLIKPVVIIYIILHVLAILLNVFGRLSLAKAFSITAISGLIQVVSLTVFVHMLTEALDLHIRVSTAAKMLFSRVSAQRTRLYFQRLLLFVSIVLWLMVFCINLNIIGAVFDFALQILEKERTFGSVTFTLENVLFFAVTIWLANSLQKNVGYFFSGHDVSFAADSGHKGSKLALIRLLIIVVGFLIAITVSGVPLTRITVLLGALGVGIGLGMQNIVNNFVSGIILIFEKPFTIGDYIELADKKGKVLDIGIRSSRMLTPLGSKVIIPNGDLLSGRLVNYTTSDARLKAEITFKISIEADIELVKKVIHDIVDNAEGTVKNAPRQILFNAIAADNIELKILVWLNDVYQETTFKSYVLEQTLIRFKAAGIKIM